MIEFLHMTAQYSNAVLVAVLPYVSDFAARLNLPIQQPVTIQQVRKYGITSVKDRPDAGIWLTNKYWFYINHRGFVAGFRARTNVFHEQGADFTKYAGQDHMTTNEAITMARETLIKLGYKPEFTHSDETPTLEGPYDTRQGHMPYCRVIWQWPKGEEDALTNLNHIYIEINTETKALVGMTLFFCDTNRLATTPIKVGVETELEKDYQKRTRPKMFFDSNAPSKLPPDKGGNP
jgi:hypothetical protein